jgi:hypothetical protein
MRRQRVNKELLNEEVKRFKMLSEYSFYEDRGGEEIEADEIIYGSVSEEEEEDIEAMGDEIEADLGLDDTETADAEDEEATEEPEEEISLDAEEEDLGFGDEEAVEDDSVELDVTELVRGSEEAKESADAANEKIDQLMGMVGKLESQLQSMDSISSKIDNLESELEKRAPTPEEKIEMRSLSSYPYNLKLTDFWGDKEGIYDVMGDEEKEEEYVLTKDDVESDYSDTGIKDSFDNPYEEEEF